MVARKENPAFGVPRGDMRYKGEEEEGERERKLVFLS